MTFDEAFKYLYPNDKRCSLYLYGDGGNSKDRRKRVRAGVIARAIERKALELEKS